MKHESITISETCSCGATFNATYPYHLTETSREQTSAWRKDHQHAESVGICGNQPPPLMLDGIAVDRLYMTPHCTLKAGHAGLHSDGQGHWTDRADVTDEVGA